MFNAINTNAVKEINFNVDDKNKEAKIQPQVAFMNSVFPNFAGNQNDGGDSAAFQA